MREKSGNTRRATQDLDIDFIRYSLSGDSINRFISKINCIEDFSIQRIGPITELRHQDYHGKRVNIIVYDTEGYAIKTKIDFGVNNHLEIEQEEFCFNVTYDSDGVILLINSNEQMFVEKLRSLLIFGPISTRYKDVFDMYYLIHLLDIRKLMYCLNTYIFSDSSIRENDLDAVINRMKTTFNNITYLQHLSSSDKRWIDEDIQVVLNNLLAFFDSINYNNAEQ